MPTLTFDLPDIRTRLIAKAEEVGFTACRITRPDAIPQVPERLDTFLREGREGGMAWMKDRAHWRADPRVLWPDCRSIVMLAEAYPAEDALAGLEEPETGNISVYSRGKDYHDVVKKRLKRLARWMVAEIGCEVKVFVDTAPVAEKPLAEAAGLGWQGKHTNLVGRDLGNWFFIGSIFTTADLVPDPAEKDHCGSCTRCLDACPTDAFPAPYQLDARRCISYLTIEHKEPVPEELRPKLGNRIYGCDDCLAVCPWNKFAADAQEIRYAARDGTQFPDLAELASLDDAAFRARFSGSPIKRIGRDRFVRNVLYAIGNSGAARLRPSAERHLNDPDPVVADAARWAVARLPAPHQ
ncbi:MAG: tRNA epoxyqueuosine(34) reductase QueG [Pseudomonadota bacterium]